VPEAAVTSDCSSVHIRIHSVHVNRDDGEVIM
jgi:hypothetical protein